MSRYRSRMGNDRKARREIGRRLRKGGVMMCMMITSAMLLSACSGGNTKKRSPKGPPEQWEKTSGKTEKGLTKKSQPWYNKMLSCPCEKLANSPTVQKQCSIRGKKRQEAWK